MKDVNKENIKTAGVSSIKSIGLLAWNMQIDDEITKLYQIRTNVTILYRNTKDGICISEIIDPEIQIVIDKLNSLRR